MSSTMNESQAQVPAKIGILVVGLGGNNGVTLLAGQLANKHLLKWETSHCGKVSAPNWSGCITQLPPKGKAGCQGVGFQGRYPLAHAANAVVGGWDIRPTPLGDALYESRVLEYDLVRQVREEMNQIPILKGIYDASFLGESQHATATHIVETEAMTWLDKVQHIRNDIVSFRQQHNIDGHITVMWSASVERPSETEFDCADDMLQAIVQNDINQDISPSMLYAIAAALEGCSFVNGGSQNTVGKAMLELYESSYRRNSLRSNAALEAIERPSTSVAYCLGTDFKAGQTKFKTAAVEYLRALGLTPRVIASSNHLGNNDMLNLTSKKTVKAKMRVKSNIFEPWQEDELDHQVRVMYTPFMLDEKRDVVEYTSLGFLHSPHTMLTYTRAMDSVLCVPLMIDSAVWCDYFARCQVSAVQAAAATAYLFKVPEGGALGIDPGFHRQMAVLEKTLRETTTVEQGGSTKDLSDILNEGVSKGILTSEQAEQLRKLQ